MHSIEGLERGIEHAKKNIRTFEEAIDQERETIQKFHDMIDVLREKQRVEKVVEALKESANAHPSKLL